MVSRDRCPPITAHLGEDGDQDVGAGGVAGDLRDEGGDRGDDEADQQRVQALETGAGQTETSVVWHSPSIHLVAPPRSQRDQTRGTWNGSLSSIVYYYNVKRLLKK